MYERKFMFDCLIESLKDVIIPDLSTDLAKEQAIAMISVLKNMEATTIENLQYYTEENDLLIRCLLEISSEIINDNQFSNQQLMNWAKGLPSKIINLVQFISDHQERWTNLNKLESELIQLLYKNEDKNLESYTLELISRVRGLMRYQLDVEMSRVR